MKILVSHPTGNRNVRAVVEGFYYSSRLTEFATSIAINKNSVLAKLLPNSLKKELVRRSFNLPESLIWSHPVLEFMRILLPKFGLTTLTRCERSWASIDSVYRDFDVAVVKRISYHYSKNNITGAYAYEDGALQTFKKAKELGLVCVYDLPIAYWKTVRHLLNTEAERLPQWKKTLGGGITDSQHKLERKTKELDLADIIVGPSQFVLDSLPQWAITKPVIMAPFGSPLAAGTPSRRKDEIIISGKERPLRVLFAGSMGQRKGLGDLFQAMKLLNQTNVELVVMGSLLDSMDFYRGEFAQFSYEAGRPHHEVLALMRSCDVFCLPSIAEGRALVMQEAMSQGLPLIITPNTGGEDLIEEGKTGFLVPIRSPEVIADKIAWFADHRTETMEMGWAAQEKAAQYTWEQYGQTIIEGLTHLLESWPKEIRFE